MKHWLAIEAVNYRAVKSSVLRLLEHSFEIQKYFYLTKQRRRSTTNQKP